MLRAHAHVMFIVLDSLAFGCYRRSRAGLLTSLIEGARNAIETPTPSNELLAMVGDYLTNLMSGNTRQPVKKMLSKLHV